ncbi:MAG TPA: hypothetical protein PK264_04705 [Hyphomicrobiaceae bacterium]|nr:hypothetical protein [Hyphomicrobiaceae bacterium]
MTSMKPTMGAVCALVLAGSALGCGDSNNTKPPVAGDSPPPALIGSWDLVHQDRVNDVAAQKIVVTFTPDGKHTWGPVMSKCTYRFKKPDKLIIDCTKSVAGAEFEYILTSVDATDLVLTNPATNPDQVNKLKRK